MVFDVIFPVSSYIYSYPLTNESLEAKRSALVIHLSHLVRNDYALFWQYLKGFASFTGMIRDILVYLFDA